MNLIGEFKKQHSLSVIKDPFKKDMVTAIAIFYTTTWGEPYWSANIEFSNGNTQGKQSTPHCETYDEVMIKLKEIINSIN